VGATAQVVKMLDEEKKGKSSHCGVQVGGCPQAKANPGQYLLVS
jgi:hypothetical protein